LFKKFIVHRLEFTVQKNSLSFIVIRLSFMVIQLLYVSIQLS